MSLALEAVVHRLPIEKRSETFEYNCKQFICHLCIIQTLGLEFTFAEYSVITGRPFQL